MSEEKFQKVANKDDLKEGDMLRVEANGKQIVLSMVEGKVYAIDEICTHEGGPLDEGELNSRLFFNLCYISQSICLPTTSIAPSSLPKSISNPLVVSLPGISW
jgi:hypothetical protein